MSLKNQAEENYFKVTIIFSGGYGYSIDQYNPWPWLESQAAAEEMAFKVASWPERYKCDGIDLVKHFRRTGFPHYSR